MGRGRQSRRRSRFLFGLCRRAHRVDKLQCRRDRVFYTDDFDDTYKELNFSLGNGFLSLDASFGQYENFSGPTQDYSFYTVKADHNNVYALIGSFGGDFEGEYYEAGYGFEAQGLDFSIAVIHGTSALLGEPDNSIVFSIGKSLDLR